MANDEMHHDARHDARQEHVLDLAASAFKQPRLWRHSGAAGGLE
jgi:hypothetical protein